MQLGFSPPFTRKSFITLDVVGTFFISLSIFIRWKMYQIDAGVGPAGQECFELLNISGSYVLSEIQKIIPERQCGI